jgi:hypothetical protein
MTRKAVIFGWGSGRFPEYDSGLGHDNNFAASGFSKKPLEQLHNGCPKGIGEFLVPHEFQYRNETHEDEAQPDDVDQRSNGAFGHKLNCLNTEARAVGLRSNFQLQFSYATGPTTTAAGRWNRSRFSLVLPPLVTETLAKQYTISQPLQGLF